jgi:hypothetical protein
MRQFGFNPELEKLHRTPQDWLFGALSLKGIADDIDCLKYLPQGELQNIGEEKMDCATRTPLNILETQFDYCVQEKVFSEENIKWLRDRGYTTLDGHTTFSDAYIAIKSGTSRAGNSLKAPLQAISNVGLIPKLMLPQVEKFDDYYNPKRITKEMEDLGKEFLARFPINYDIVTDYPSFIKKVPLDTAGFAWPAPVNGIYPRTDNPFNHSFMIFPPTLYRVFDNYLDYDNDFLKTLAPNYKLLDYSYRIILNENRNYVPPKKSSLNFLIVMLQWLKTLFSPTNPEQDEAIKIIQKVITDIKPDIKPDNGLIWDKANARHSVRVICDEFHLSWNQKDLICDICSCESQFNPNAKRINSPKSIDRGLFQINSFYHPDITDKMAYDPEYSVRWACKALKDKKVKTYWSASMKCWNKSGKYNDLLV